MSKPRDVEYFVFQLIDDIKNNLNTKITAINTEKSDSITLNTVDSNAYFYLTFGDGMPNYDPIVIFTVNVEPTNTAGGVTAEKIFLATEMIISDELTANDDNTLKRILRYRRAIKEIIEEKFAKYHAVQIVDIPAVPFIERDSMFIAFGVGIEFYIA